MQNVEVTTAFAGAAWNQEPLATMRGDLNAFFEVILQSEVMDELSMYGRPDAPLGRGSRVGSVTTSDVLPAIVRDADIATIVSNASGGIATNGNTLLFLYFPPNVSFQVAQDGVGANCSGFCGYHERLNGVAYAVVPYLDCQECRTMEDRTVLTAFQAITEVSSHELMEAVTDANLDGWAAGDGSEIGDLCNAQWKLVGGYYVQKGWLNGRGCV